MWGQEFFEATFYLWGLNKINLWAKKINSLNVPDSITELVSESQDSGSLEAQL